MNKPAYSIFRERDLFTSEAIHTNVFLGILRFQGETKQCIVKEMHNTDKYNYRSVFKKEERIYKTIFDGKKTVHKTINKLILSNLEKQVLIFEYFSTNTLLEYLNWYYDNDELIEKNNWNSIINQVIKGLRFLHDNKIAHLDIKPENILIDFRTTKIKIIDFGWSYNFSETEEINQLAGSRYYIAPEIMEIEFEFTKRKTYNCRKADQFSLGMLIFVLSFNELPFVHSLYTVPFAVYANYKSSTLEKLIIEKEFEYSKDTDFLCKLLKFDPLQRHKDIHEIYSEFQALFFENDFQ